MELEKAVLATEETIEGVLERLLPTFSRRLVALCGATVELDDQGKIRKETFFCYTGFLIEADERWYMVTAGHCLKNFEEALVHPMIRLTGVALVGGFGPSSTRLEPVLFHHYADAPRNAVYDKAKGLDYGWIEIRQYYRNFLEQEGALPIPLIEVNQPARGEVWGHVIVGFPDELVEKNLNVADQADPIKGEIEPVMITAPAMNPVPADLAAIANLWFIGQLNPTAPLRSALGLSGGPIIEIAEDGNPFKFRMLALQSWWLPPRRIVFGCLVSVFLPKILAEIESNQQAGHQPST
jgi:hypothetical protein